MFLQDAKGIATCHFPIQTNFEQGLFCSSGQME